MIAFAVVRAYSHVTSLRSVLELAGPLVQSWSGFCWSGNNGGTTKGYQQISSALLAPFDLGPPGVFIHQAVGTPMASRVPLSSSSQSPHLPGPAVEGRRIVIPGRR
jgi:hypothetical protein